MTLEEYQAQQAAKKAQQKAAPKAKASNEMTLEEYQAAQKAKKEAAKTAPKVMARPAEKQKEPPKEDPMKEEPPKDEEKPPAPAPAAPTPSAPSPAAAAAPAPAEEDKEDWEEEEEEPEAKAPPAKEEPKPEPVKEAPVAKAAEPAPAAAEPSAEEAAEEAAEEDEEEEDAAEADKPTGEVKRAEPDPRPHLNVVFIGHVDAGKSTSCGNILYLTGCVDERTIEKYMKEAKDKNRESWFLAYIMDTSDEEKAKGKTVEVGRAHFATSNRRFTVLDAPGHKSYVPNMIAGASQADVGVLIISARKGEFETGFERGGQTREHALLAKTLGVDKLIIAVNKMDDTSVQWAEERYTEIMTKLSPFLKTSGFKDEQLMFLPMSGLVGDNIKDRKNTPDWYKGKTLLDTLDSIEVPGRNKDKPLRIPMLDGFRDMGSTIAIGKVEQGTVRPGQKCIIMPIGTRCTVQAVYIKDEEMQYATCGENVTLKMSGCTESELSKGFVLAEASAPVRVVSKFKAQLQIIELPEERPVMTSGYCAVLHVHVAAEECEILKLYESMSMVDRKKKEKNPRFVREGSVVTCSIQLARPTSVDVFTGVQQLGRFTLRDEGRTIAIGKITELPKEGSK